MVGVSHADDVDFDGDCYGVACGAWDDDARRTRSFGGDSSRDDFISVGKRNDRGREILQA